MIDEVLREGGRLLTRQGLTQGTSGNLSVREDDRIHMTGTGTNLGDLTASSVAVLTLDGRHLEGPKPSKEVFLHLAFYRKNPDHRAVVHVHSASMMALSCLPAWKPQSAIMPLTPYFVMRVGQTPLFPYRRPGDADLGRLITDSGLDFHGILLAHHGQVTSGTDLARAIDAAIELEEACRIQLLTHGKHPEMIDRDEVRELAHLAGRPWSL